MKILIDLYYGGQPCLRDTPDHRPKRLVKPRRALDCRTMLAFHEELGLLPRVAGKNKLRNKIPELRGPRDHGARVEAYRPGFALLPWPAVGCRPSRLGWWILGLQE
jgi:hypothetical protein